MKRLECFKRTLLYLRFHNFSHLLIILIGIPTGRTTAVGAATRTIVLSDLGFLRGSTVEIDAHYKLLLYIIIRLRRNSRELKQTGYAKYYLLFSSSSISLGLFVSFFEEVLLVVSAFLPSFFLLFSVCLTKLKSM